MVTVVCDSVTLTEADAVPGILVPGANLALASAIQLVAEGLQRV